MINTVNLVGRQKHRRITAAVWLGVLGLLACGASAQSPFDPPGAQVLSEARALVQSMIGNPRGPYSRIRWYCNDGTVQPPQAFACSDRGGGRQHAEYSEQRRRLAELGWSTGTIIAALTWDEFYDAGRRQQRLRELALEKYLTDIDDGWVLHRARDYRGRVQIEDEEAAGQNLLLQLLDNRQWVEENFLLARESVRTLPHRGGAEDTTRDARRDAIDIVERDNSFERLRVEVHTIPSAATAGRIRAWAQSKPAEINAAALALAARLDALYGAAGRRERLTEQRTRLAAQPSTVRLAEHLDFTAQTRADERLASLAGLLRDARDTIQSPVRAIDRILLFDVISDTENELAVTAAELLQGDQMSRAQLLLLAEQLVDATFGAGLTTEGERNALRSALPANSLATLATKDYARVIGYLRRLPQWAVGSARFSFAEPLVRYGALDSRANAFVDDLLRSSPLAAMAEVTRRLAKDLADLTGVTQNINGRIGAAAFGLNPGVAVGNLRIFETSESLEHGQYARTDIVLLPETVAELSPVAGIVTLGEGSPLSHVQLLARNFGIPNIAIVPDLLPTIRPLENTEVLAAVASDGSVVLIPTSEMRPEIRDLLRPADQTGNQLTVPRPDLATRQPIALAELNSSLSGRVVGPKAANLGQLARLFPGRVAPAVALPFGIFAEHMNTGTPSLRQRLVDAYAGFRRNELTQEELLAALAAIRQDIAGLQLAPQRQAELAGVMQREFGSGTDYGLFIRSDTNVEDLPQFTGAGLSETLPNLVGFERQIASIPRVWASVLSPRAIAWRSNLLTNPEEVYASVLLMQSVASDKSGVMVTSDLTGLSTGLTVSTGWGVGGAVGGEAVETLVLHADGTDTLISEAKTAYQRQLDPSGGMRWRPAADGRVLTNAEKSQLRDLAQEVLERYEPVFDENATQRPWDIEFGFVNGELTLFQIRPLVERGPQLANRIVQSLSPQTNRTAAVRVTLADPPISLE